MRIPGIQNQVVHFDDPLGFSVAPGPYKDHHRMSGDLTGNYVR